MTDAAAADSVAFGGAAPLRGRVRVPGDKSISHRALLFAAMADGDSLIHGLARGDDVRCTAAILGQLGVTITETDDGVTVGGRGVDALREPSGVLDCGNSGTTMRTLIGLLAGRPFLTVLSGDDSLRARPMARVIDPLRAMGARIDGRADGTRAPVVVRGGALQRAVYTLPVASAQVKTAIVLAALQAHGTSEISEPAPSRDHTERMLAALGAPVSMPASLAGRTLRVEAGAPRPFELRVPGDPSSAAFWSVAATITPGSDITIEGVALNPTRIGFVDVLRRMGASIEVTPTGEELGEPVGELRIVAGALHATAIGGDEIPLVQDEIPVLAVAAAFADGVTEITDAAELRVKESDRIATVAELMSGLGVGVEAQADGLRIRGGAPHPGQFASHRDHRIAMAAAVSAHALDGESTVAGWSAATVSYPEFLADLAALTGRAG
ncbi:MAG: 3-phosphoshikimate 1-carboxyvinyltransferase [Acidimicrobiia bacterium]